MLGGLRAAVVAAATLVLAACGKSEGTAAPQPDVEAQIPAAELRVLWIGNSLTEWNDLPALFERVADAAGKDVATGTLTAPDVSLEDHWLAGVAPAVVHAERADVVVLQQGPSSLPENQTHLRDWSRRFADLVRASGGRPALYMVWPPESRDFAFDDVRNAYAGAAEAVDGYLIPGGEAMREAWRRDPRLGLRGGDGFHPTPLGSLLVALVAYGVLFGEPVTELPASAIPASFELSPAQVELLLDAAETTVRAYGRR